VVEGHGMTWDDYAIEHGHSEIGAHSDKHIVDLENYFIETILQRLKPTTILDVGCGNGRRTERWSKYAKFTTGIDNSNEMIKLAKELEIDDLTFYQESILDMDCKVKYDAIISARCLINIKPRLNQYLAINKIAEKLTPNGVFICCEGRETGTMNLNEIRKRFGVEELTLNTFNLDLNDIAIELILKKFPFRLRYTSLNTYYFLTRAFKPAIEKRGLENINEIAKQIQTMIGDDDSSMGRHFCYAGRKQ
jgi:SAM-dependent methyltransferase